MLISPSLVRFPVDHSNFFPWLICQFLLQQLETWLLTSSIRLVNCCILVNVSQYQSCQLISSWETTLSTRVQCFICSSFCLSLTDSIRFHSYLNHRPFLQLPSVTLFHVFVIWLEFFVIECIVSWNPPTSLVTFENLYTLRFTLCAVCLDKWMACVHHHSISQNSFTTLKISYAIIMLSIYSFINDSLCCFLKLIAKPEIIQTFSYVFFLKFYIILFYIQSIIHVKLSFYLFVKGLSSECRF